MATESERPSPATTEAEARSIWALQRLPPASGTIGTGEGTIVHLLEGSFAPRESGMLVVQRAIAADVDARALALGGRRANGVLRKEEGGPPTPQPPLGPLLASLAVWVGGDGGRTWDDASRHDGIERLAGRLAHIGALAIRDVALRICPACGLARDPERIVYQEEGGDTLLVRFPFAWGERTVSALVWTDAAWRLLGTSALLVHPDHSYVVARYRRRGAEELVLTSKSSLPRIRAWMPDSEFEVLEEHPGQHWVGTSYQHPLRHEFPAGSGLDPPAGTILAITDVTDTGTGIVPLVPGHGGTDAVIAERLSVPGWPLITPKGRFDIMLVHKYAGLDLDSGNGFVIRDLAESGAIFAQLRVRRGVPHCARCGTALIWAPGRAWCLEPSRLPADRLALYRTFLPHDRPIERLEAVPWTVSEPTPSTDPSAIALLECTSCDRLEAVGASGDRCPCGGRRRAVRRRLLPGFGEAAAAWATLDPFPPADAVRLYVNDRRRAPSVVHHLAAMSGITGVIRDVHLSVLPTAPELDLSALVAEHGADAVRSALVRVGAGGTPSGTFVERCAQERRRLERFAAIGRAVAGRIGPALLSEYAQPITGFVGELDPEDRALLARFERMRVQCAAAYDRGAAALVHRYLFRFLENDLVTYLAWVAPRLSAPGSLPTKRSAHRTLLHVLSSATVLLAPIAPHTADSVHRSLARPRASVFQEAAPGVDRTLLDDNRVRAWDRWAGVARAIERFRRALGVGPEGTLPVAVLVLPDDPAGDEYRADASIVERLARVQKVEVYSPSTPWPGRRRQVRPIEAQIQRVYASQASQIIHLLKRIPERRWGETVPAGGFTMMVNGQPTQILPTMLEWRETIPERLMPVAWPLGELYVEVPPGREMPARRPPPLSPDAFRVVERLERRLKLIPSPEPSSRPVAIVIATDPLAEELRSVAPPLAAYLGLSELRVAASESAAPGLGRISGRSRAGARWTVRVSVPPTGPRARKARAPSHAGGRVRPAYSPDDVAPTMTDYSDESILARRASVRSLVQELDDLLGVAVLGPSKVDAAWELGLHSLDDFRQADWETLAAIPGFGPPVASALVTRLGGTLPPRPPRTRRVRAPLPVEGEPASRRSEASSAPSAFAGGGPPRLPETVHYAASVPSDRLEVRSPAMPPPVPGSMRPSPAVPPAGVPAAPPASGPALPEMPAAMAPAVPAARPSPVTTSALPSVPEAWTSPEVPAPPLEAANQETAVAVRSREDSPIQRALEPETPTLAAPASAMAEVPVPAGEGTSSSPSLAPELNSISGPEVAATSGEAAGIAEGGPSATAAEPVPETAPLPEAPPLSEPAAPEPESANAPVPAPSTSPQEEVGGAEVLPLASETTIEPTPLQAPPTAPQADESSKEAGVPAVAPAAPPEPGPVTGPQPPQIAGPPIVVPALAGPVASLPALTPGTQPAALAPSPSPPEPVVQQPPEPVPSPPPPAAGVELGVGPRYVASLERFLDATAAGHQGICIVRDSPERVRAYVGSRPVEVRWLTNIGRGATLKPTDLEGLSAFVAHAASTGRVTVFFIEGVEYLVRLHGLERVVAEMAKIDEVARANSARVWIHLNPVLLSPTELDRFTATFPVPSAGN